VILPSPVQLQDVKPWLHLKCVPGQVGFFHYLPTGASFLAWISPHETPMGLPLFDGDAMFEKARKGGDQRFIGHLHNNYWLLKEDN
jgi:hypothetical protein